MESKMPSCAVVSWQGTPWFNMSKQLSPKSSMKLTSKSKLTQVNPLVLWIGANWGDPVVGDYLVWRLVQTGGEPTGKHQRADFPQQNSSPGKKPPTLTPHPKSEVQRRWHAGLDFLPKVTPGPVQGCNYISLVVLNIICAHLSVRLQKGPGLCLG